MAKEDFIAVSADDWYERRRQDAVGAFFRKVADQGPRKGEGGGTRQGIYCLTAEGKLLTYKNAGQNADVMREVLKQALETWKKLPEEQRKPGAVRVENPGGIDPPYTRKVPSGAVVVKVYTRILDVDTEGAFCKGTCTTRGGDKTARDHLWLTESDIKSLAPTTAKVSDRFPLPATIAERIVRFHLIDNTRGEPPMWTKAEVRSCDLTLTVTAATENRVEFRLEGTAVLATDADTSKAERGFDVRLLGYVGFDLTKRALDRFDIVAIGDHWGEARYTPNARKGRKPLGVAFELAHDDVSARRVPPQAARDITAYLGTGK